MSRARSAAWWITPSLLCLVIYWMGLKAWFRADDFAWLALDRQIYSLRDALHALFSPQAQGTIRPWTDRGFFMGLYALFGLDPLPFRIGVFATQFANLALVASVTRRITASPAAGFWAAVFWIVNSSQGQVMSWNAAYNQVLCGFFLLAAFYCLLRYCETGRPRFWIAQWAIFLLGFGALETNIVYPVLAALYTALLAPKHFRRTLPLFVPSILFGALHKLLAPLPTSGVYAPHFGPSMLRTLATYWTWTVGPTWMLSPLELPAWFVPAAVAVLTAILLAVVIITVLRHEWRPFFFLAWFVIVLGPLLPFRDHLTEYYPFLPAIGLAMLGGWAFATVWEKSIPWKLGGVLAAALYVTISLPAARTGCAWTVERSLIARKVVLGVARAHELHPDKIILLDDVDGETFWNCIGDYPFRVLGLRDVYLTPGTEEVISKHPEWGDPSEFVLPADATLHALEKDQVVVYSVAASRLRNTTTHYTDLFRLQHRPSSPRRVDVANPLLDYVLGPTWYGLDQNHRWMPRQATVRMGGPRTATEKLYLSGVCTPEHTGTSPIEVRVHVDGHLLPAAEVQTGQTTFELAFPLPAVLIGKENIEVAVEVNRAITPPADGRTLGLAFGVFEIR